MESSKKYKTILQEDECAPDASQEFNREFLELFGVSLKEFLKDSIPEDLGDVFLYYIGNFRITNEVGLWKVESVGPSFER